MEIVLPPLGGDMEWPTAFAEASASQEGHTIDESRRPVAPECDARRRRA